MHYYINDAKISCPCINSNDPRSLNSMSKMHFCPTCKIRRCFQCTLHSISKKSCLRCDREYGLKDTHCYRCYVCPVCDHDLESYPLLYKSKVGDNGVEYERIRSKSDKSKIIGKAVQFRCVNSSCKYRFTTEIETKPQSLQQIVQNNIKDEDDVRYNALMDYYDWCLNYQRILDKRQRTKWKSEILNRFKSLEIAKILEDTDNLKQLSEKEDEIIKPLADEIEDKLYPLPKLLHAEMNDICPTCLGDISAEKMASYVPLVYTVPMIGYPSSNLKNLKDGESVDVPVLVSISNKGKQDLRLNIIESNNIAYSAIDDLVIPFTDQTGLPTSPTCLLPHVSKKEGNWKGELAQRNSDVLSKLKYSDEFNVENFDSTIDHGINWVTVLVVVNVTYNKETNSKVEFVLNIGGDLNVQYHCIALV